MAFGDFSFEDVSPVVMGIVTTLVLGTLVGAAFVVGIFGAFEDRYDASAVFDEAGGLRAGADVVIAGVPVGEVRSIDPDFATGQVVVGFAVDDEVALSQNTRAEIRLGTLFGGFTLELVDPGGTQRLADLPVEDRRIGLESTAAPDGIVEALDASTEAIGQLDVDAVNRVAGQVATVLDGTREDLPALFAELGELGELVDRRSDELERLIVDGQRLVDAAVAQEDELVALVDEATALLEQLSASRDELETVVGEGNEAVVAMTALLAENRAELERLTDTVHEAVGRTAARRAEINRALATLGPTIEEFNGGFKGDFVDLYSDLPLEALVTGAVGLPAPSPQDGEGGR